jgi:ATP-dependent helicase/nuclease subunit A
MNRIGHEMILASAGSGKTYALTHRFVRLLAHGAPPERIVALTFTRKAAGEFFDEILKKLARAAASPDQARKLAAEIGRPEASAADFGRMLRAVVDAMPRLNLGTLDGFFARVVQAFPLELGLAGEFQIMDGATARRERRRVLRGMFAAAGQPDAAQREFIEAFKRATFGVDEKRLAGLLDGFLDDHGETFLAAPRAEQWGEPARIWPEGCAWLAAAGRLDAATAALRTAAEDWALEDKPRARLAEFFAALAEWSPGAALAKPMEYVLKNAFEAGPELEEITLERRTVAVPAAVRPALRAVVEGIAGAELARRLEMTRGIFAVLSGYDRSYDETVRRAGQLTFADVLRRLLPAAGAPVLAGETGTDEERVAARLAVDWRLDAKFDHWLLDEFQDTSAEQWSVLRNLVDEAVQDPEGRRSLFYVGDVKQAIFAWRGGDPRLFRDIFNHYNRAAPGTIAERRLDDSWRSGPAVIATVNRVFGAEAAIAEVLPAPAAAGWRREWRDHVSAQPGLGGYAELRPAADEAGRFAATLRILQETEPARRGLEAAVLVQKNSTAAALADYLRREGNLPAVAESDLHVATDNPLTTALLALLRAAAHPGDTLARELVRMSPLEGVLTAAGIASRDGLVTAILADVHERGFAGTIERWLRRLAPVVAAATFGEERGRLLVAAAEKFDESGSRDVAEFLAYAEHYTSREADLKGVVRVLTVHKAKGLGFDLVILPDLEGKKLATRRDGLAVRRTDEGGVDWILELPAKLFAERDPVLAAHVAAAESEAAYENLCLLYVAMTRAKRAMYLITEPAAAKSTSRNFTRLLRDTLGDSWREGDPRWFESVNPLADADAADRADEGGDAADWNLRRARRPARTPSALKASAVNGALVFSLDRNAGADFGTEVHARFAEVEWVEPGMIDVWRAAWAGAGGAGAAAGEALACLTEPALAEIWTRPKSVEAGGNVAVWRERPFETVLDGAWVTGIFDRVVLERDADGRSVRATVIDFKTDRLVSAADRFVATARHAAQLNLYRRVVATLAGVALSDVRCQLVFTRLRCAVAVPSDESQIRALQAGR